MATVHDVAAYILNRCGQMSTMKLQKLCYYAQGWSLAWDGRPIFESEIQAWANGPVVYDLFRRHRGLFTVDAWPSGDAAALTEDESDTVDAVIDGYGQLSGQQLSDKTHEEPPWLQARGDMPAGVISNIAIDLDVMQQFFSALDAERR